MKFFNPKLIFILLLALVLRLWNYVDFPIGGETADESAWAFLGSSLIQERQPTSWSYFAPYQDEYIYENRTLQNPDLAPLVRPALDHPPLFSFLPGLAHTLKGNWQEFPSLKVIRLPMVLLGVVNVALVWWVARILFASEKKTKEKLISSNLYPYLAALIYATVPTFVFASRLVVAENLLVTWTLLALGFLLDSKIKNRFGWLVLVGVGAIMSKFSGVIIPLGIIGVGLVNKDKKAWQSGIIGLVVGALLFLGYGAIYNFQLLIDIFMSQAGRDVGLVTLHNRFFLHPGVVEKIFFDGWVFLGLMATGWLLIRNSKKSLPINIFLILNLLFILATSGEMTFHAWYDYMLYPLFVLAFTFLGKQVWEKSNYLFFGLGWVILLPVIQVLLYHLGLYSEVSSLMMKVIMALGMIPFLTSLIGQQKIAKLLMGVLFLGLIVINILAVANFNQKSYWESDSTFRYPWCADFF